MNRKETAGLLAVVKMHWPHSRLAGTPEQVVAFWEEYLAAVPFAAAKEAIDEMAASGREHAPGPGLVAKVVAERLTDLPDWDQAWEEILTLIARHGSYNPPGECAFSHPAVAAFALPSWAELCAGPAPGTRDYGTHYAQQREAYKALRGRVERGTSLALIGAPRRAAVDGGGLKRLAAPHRLLPGGEQDG